MGLPQSPQSSVPFLVADLIAAAFHDNYERLAPEFGYKTRAASNRPWGEVPDANRALMRATITHLIDSGIITPGSSTR